jgi:hypothetical protein
LDRARALYAESKDDFSGLQADFYRASERALIKKRFWAALTVGLFVAGIVAAFYMGSAVPVSDRTTDTLALPRKTKPYDAGNPTCLAPFL